MASKVTAVVMTVMNENADIKQSMPLGRQKYIFLIFILYLTCALFAVASEDSYSTVFGASSKDACYGNECLLNDARSSSSANANKNILSIHVIITFTNAEYKRELQTKFALTVSSLFRHSTRPVTLYVIGDARSQLLAKNILAKHVTESEKYTLVPLNIVELAKNLSFIIQGMQDHFSLPGAYYSHELFFLSVAMHRIMPESIDRVIMLDADLKFLADIAHLYRHFEEFDYANIIGIAHDQQPVYRHNFWQFRKEYPGTRIGELPPYGLPGFNSGVLLLDLNRMRQSSLYNSLLDQAAISCLCEEFHFKGNLGDQDFYTLLGMRYEHLFYVLPCQWNRQLCRWWSDKGYEDVFELYHRCDGDIMVYHGNCNTPIP